MNQSNQQPVSSNPTTENYPANPNPAQATSEAPSLLDAVPNPSLSISQQTTGAFPLSPQNASENGAVPSANGSSTQYESPNALTSLSNEDDDERQQSFHFQGDPSMAYQVAIHDDIISKHSIRQQRMGLDGIDNDNRFLPSVDYVRVFAVRDV